MIGKDMIDLVINIVVWIVEELIVGIEYYGVMVENYVIKLWLMVVVDGNVVLYENLVWVDGYIVGVYQWDLIYFKILDLMNDDQVFVFVGVLIFDGL